MKKRELLAMIQALEARVLFLETAKPFRYVDGTTGDPWHPFSGATCGDVGPQTTASSTDTVRKPAEKIAEANAESSFVGGLARDPSNPVGWMIDGKFVENPNHRTHERGTGYPITESDESKRIAEAVANTPHSC